MRSQPRSAADKICPDRKVLFYLSRWLFVVRPSSLVARSPTSVMARLESFRASRTLSASWCH